MATSIFPGQFQPFHEGHLLVVQGMAKMSGDPIIVICNGKDDGPFTVQQRREMISAALLSANIMDATIVEASDRKVNEEWVDVVLEAAGNPAEPMVWSGNEDVRKLFEAKGVATKKIVHVPNMVTSEIRDKILAKDPSWRSKIPAGAVDVIDEWMSKR